MFRCFHARLAEPDFAPLAVLCEQFTEDISPFADRAVEDIEAASALTCSDLTSHFWREQRFIAR